ncbi:MAG: AraC family transcriptional regulator [Clostridia bacterium]|nr:AraC family transcriptional regulator [Clostridia bacterium]
MLARKARMKKVRDIYTPLLIMVSVIVLVVSLVFAGIYHGVTVRKNEEVYALELRNAMAKTAELMRSARTVPQQVAYDSVAYALMNFRTMPVTSYMQSLMQLRRYRNINTSIDSIYLYHAKTQDVFVCGNIFRQAEYTLDDLPDKDFASLLAMSNLTGSYHPIARTITSDNSNYGSDTADVFTFLYSLASAGEFAQYDTVAVNFYQDSLVSYAGGQADGRLMIYASPEGKLQYASCEKELGYVAAQEIARHFQQEDVSGGWKAALSGGEYYIVAHYDEMLGWIGALAVPYETIGAESRKVVLYSLLICGALILLAWLCSFLVSYRIYRASGLERMREMGEKRLFKSLLSGREVFEEAELEEHLAEYDVALQAGGKTCLVALRIDRWPEFYAARGNEGVKDIENSVLAFFSSEAAGIWESAVMEDGEIAFLYQPYDGEMNCDLMTICGKAQACMAQQAGLSFMVDEEGTPLADAGIRYMILSETLYVYRAYHGYSALANLRDIQIGEKVYPKQEEKAIIEGLKLADFSRVRAGFDSFVDQIAHDGLHYINLALVQLNLKLDDVIDTVVKNNKLDVPPHTFDIYIRFEQVELIDEIREQFYRVFDALEAALYNGRANKQKKLGEQIAAYIEAHYQEADLSRQQICDILHVPYTTAGTAFKALGSGGMSAYIVEVRLRHACEQLVETDQPIETIAAQCGFASAVYFHRVFKKQYGVTPGEYRRHTQREEEK